MFRGEINEDLFRKAEQLLDELRGESPLRHRLSTELDELRKMHQAPKKKTRRAVAKST